MATSGTTTFNLTRNELVKSALRLINAYASGEEPEPSEIDDTVEAGNIMIKAWQSEGIGIWKNTEQTLTLVGDQQSYTIGPGGDLDIARPTEVNYARLRIDGGSDIPVDIVPRNTYLSLATKTTDGKINQIYYDPQTILGVLYVWPTADDTDDTLIITCRQPIEDLGTLANTIDIPVEYLRALKFNLALEIAPEFEINPSNLVVARAEETKNILMGFDTEQNSVYFGMESGY